MTRNYSSAGIVFEGSAGAHHQNVTIRRSVIVDTWTTTNFIGNGIYIEASDGVLIEENVVDSNGWTTSHPHGSDGPGHNMYIHNDNTGVVIHGNIVANTDGVQLRSGGVCSNNLFLKNAISFEMGAGTNPNPGGVSGVINGNVILDGNNFPGNVAGGSGNRGWGYCLGNCVGVTMSNNIAAHNSSGSSPRPWVLNFQNNGNPQGLQDVTIDHNVVYDWGSTGSGAQVASYQSNIILNLTVTNNDVQNSVDNTDLASITSTTPNLPIQIHGAHNRWFGAQGGGSQIFQLSGVNLTFTGFVNTIGDVTSTFGQVQYPDANRTIASYNASIGGGASLSAFIAQARMQSKTNWRTDYTADAVNEYIRSGFGMPQQSFAP